MPYNNPSFLEETCIECGRHFYTKVHKTKCDYCLENPIIVRKEEKETGRLKLIKDPSGDFIVGSLFTELEVILGDRNRVWSKGTIFRNNKKIITIS